MGDDIERSWFSIPFTVEPGQVFFSFLNPRPWAFQLWDEENQRVVWAGVMSDSSDKLLCGGARGWRLEVDTEGLTVKPVFRRSVTSIGIDLVHRI
jgi:hypothetical protein